MLGADYWWRNVRQPVLFKNAMDRALKLGHRTFVEIGPHTTLSGLISACAAEAGKSITVAPSMSRNHADFDVLYASLGALYTSGVDLDWTSLVDPEFNFLRLPSYPWEKERFWAESEEARSRLFEGPVHPLLGRREKSANPTWKVEIDLNSYPYISDHRVGQDILFPAAGYLEMCLAVGRELYGDVPVEVRDISFVEALALQEGKVEQLQTEFDPERSKIAIYSRTKEHDDEWVLRASARIRPLSGVSSRAQATRKANRKRNRKSVRGKRFYGTIDKCQRRRESPPPWRCKNVPRGDVSLSLST